MECSDKELVRKLVQSNAKLRKLYEEHEILHHKLERFQNRPYLTSQEEVEQRELKKRKLMGVDQMMSILAEHRPSM